MSEKKPDAQTRGDRMAEEQAARAERLAQALRQNLARRKAQSRSRQERDKDED